MEVVELLSYAWGPIAAWIIWDKKQEKLKLQDLGDRVIVLEATQVSEDKVREVVKQEVVPLLDSQDEVKTTLEKISEAVMYIRLQMAKSGIGEGD